MITQLEHELRNKTSADVYFDAIHQQVYSVDASIFEIKPIGVVIPKSKSDLVNILKIANQYNISIIPRGAATGITGGCIGSGLIVDLSKYLNQILEVNYDKEYAICQPGVIQDQLNQVLSEKGYRLGPDTSTGNRATIGGMVSNNAAGARSLRYGKMVDHVEEIEIALITGELVTFKALEQKEIEKKILEKGFEGHLYQEIQRICQQYKVDIQNNFPTIPRRVSGYNLDELIKETPLNLSQLIVGSEGTLGIITEVKVKIVPKPLFTGLCVIHFSEMLKGMQAIPDILSYSPLSLEMIDNKIIDAGRQSPSLKDKLDWLENTPSMLFVAEFEASSPKKVWENLLKFESEMKKQQIGKDYYITNDPTIMTSIWNLRKSGLGLLLSKRSYSRAVAFIEDITIDPKQLGSFMQKFQDYLKSVGKEAGIYGHVGSGCLHIRPYLDLRQAKEIELMKEIMRNVSQLLLQHHGALSGEHGDGLIRSWLNPLMFGEKIYQAFLDIKKVFDPKNRLNPGKIVNCHELSHELRSNAPHPKHIQTFLDFTQEGGFSLAVDLCNGNGMCRKPESVMCPSFQVTQDEYDSTRARAQALRGIIHGTLPKDSMTSHDVHAILDLCLECKGCKTECPSQVDMAKMKSEFLYHYHTAHGYPLRSYLFAFIGTANKLGSYFPTFFNWVSSLFLTRKFLSYIGISPSRRLPKLSFYRFSEWFKKRPSSSSKKQVVLFNDTYTEFNSPHIGEAAVSILENLGYEVILPPWNCCGRPMISKGLLNAAKKQAEQLVDILYPYAQKGLKIVGLEPSCILTLKDDYSSLIPNEKIKTISSACQTLDEFLHAHIIEGQFPLSFKTLNKEIKVHGHCHQKSLIGMHPTLETLKAIPGFHVSEISSGCCGLAGSFGYEKEHYEFSMKIGELHLFSAIRKSSLETLILASGVSCRSQIQQGTQRPALHLAEVIANHMIS